MTQLGNASGVPLSPAVDEKALQTHQWRPVVTFENWWTEKVLIQTGSVAEAQAIFNSLDGHAINVQGHCAGLAECVFAVKHPTIGTTQ